MSSKRTLQKSPTSPPKKQIKPNNTDMEKLTELIRDMKTDTEMERRKRCEEREKDRKERKEEMENIKEMIRESHESWREEKNELMNKIDRLEDRVQEMERNKRRKNIIISNFEPVRSDVGWKRKWGSSSSRKYKKKLRLLRRGPGQRPWV